MKLNENGAVTLEGIKEYKEYLLSIINKVKEYNMNITKQRNRKFSKPGIQRYNI